VISYVDMQGCKKKYTCVLHVACALAERSHDVRLLISDADCCAYSQRLEINASTILYDMI
jgi:hypothetical protein